MSGRAVIIPLGVEARVPATARGLGLGLAALVHGFTQVGGSPVGLAQLTSVARPDQPEVEPGPVETLLPAQAWRSMTERDEAPGGVSWVITGALEPPDDGPGHLELLAYDAKDGTTRARVTAHLDEATCGRALCGALEELWRTLGGQLGALPELGELEWESLQSVLRAERCLVHDPARKGPHDVLAALVHLGRAVGDAPGASFPASRLSLLALHVVFDAFDTWMPEGAAVTAAALRTVVAAAHDAPSLSNLREAEAVLRIHAGDYIGGAVAAEEAARLGPDRAAALAVLAEARRRLGDDAGAAEALARATALAPSDPRVLNELGMVAAAAGRLQDAHAAWMGAISRVPLFPIAYMNLVRLAREQEDTVSAQLLVDRALEDRAVPPHVVRAAIEVAMVLESPGIARAARVARLAQHLVEHDPDGPWALGVLGSSLAEIGERGPAVAAYTRVEQVAPRSAAAAEAQRARCALESPAVSEELEAVLRAARDAPESALEAVAARARALGRDHPSWMGPYAEGLAERRRGAIDKARSALRRALERAPGCELALADLASLPDEVEGPRPSWIQRLRGHG